VVEAIRAIGQLIAGPGKREFGLRTCCSKVPA
jgi:hypothetical protein